MNLYRHSKKRSRAPFILATTLVILVFLIDAVTGGSIRGLLHEGAVRLWSVGGGSGALFSNFFSTRKALREENKTLREENSQLKIYAAAFGVLKQENEELRTLANLVGEGSGVSAPIVSSFATSPYGTFLIGAGAANGLRGGELVIVGDARFGGFVMGRVENVDTRTSLVRGLFAGGETIDATVRDIGITLKGRGGGQAQGEAPREAAIEVGDIVTSAQVGGRAVGVVGKVEKDPSGAAERVYVHLPFSLASLSYVQVIAQ